MAYRPTYCARGASFKHAISRPWILGYGPDQSLMVACHKYDLSAARALACALRLLRALCKSGESRSSRELWVKPSDESAGHVSAAPARAGECSWTAHGYHKKPVVVDLHR